MFYVLLGAALLISASGKSLVFGLSERVQALAGGDVILPCSFEANPREDFPTVEWSKEGLNPNVVFLYRDGCETHEMKNPAFEFRTSFVMRELRKRNVSLRISNVQLSDAGTYRCMKLWRNAPWDITTVQLVVGAVSEPKLSFMSDDNRGVTLQCEAGCWIPDPEITFLDHQGNKIPADEPKRGQDISGCYCVTRRVTLLEPTKRVTCRVHQPEINQTRTTETFIPVSCMRSCHHTKVFITAGVVLFALSVLAGFLYRRCCKYDQYKLTVRRQSSDQSIAGGSDENEPFLTSVVHWDDRAGEREGNNFKIFPNPQLTSGYGEQTLNSDRAHIFREHRIYSEPDVMNTAKSALSSLSSSKKRVSFDSRVTDPPGLRASNLKRRHSSVFLPIRNNFKIGSDLHEEQQSIM